MWQMVAAAGISAAGSIAASKSAKKAAKAQQRMAERNARLFEGIKVPTIEEQKIILENPDLMGQYTPEQLQAMELNISEMENIKVDPKLQEAQEKALAGISQVAEGGFTEADKAAAREVNREVNQQSQARQKAILNAMAQRGVLGSGMELAAKLQGEQQSMDQASRAGDALTQQAQARALQALGQQGSMAGQMRQQSFGEQADIARAQDAINQFNVRNRQSVAQANMENRNQAQMYNLQQQQNLENQRAALANQQQIHNQGLIQTNYQNLMDKARAQAGMNQQVANAQAQQQMNKGAMIAGVANAIGGGLAAYGNYQQNQQNKLNQQLATPGAGSNVAYTLPANNEDPFSNT